MGKFIVLEGPDMSGKSTQHSLVVEQLKNKGYKVASRKFPRKEHPVGAAIYALLYSDSKVVSEAPKLLQGMYAADQYDFSSGELEDLLSSNDFVVLDRYMYSCLVYGVSAGISAEEMSAMQTGIRHADLVVVLNADAESLSKRGEQTDHLEGLDFQKKVVSNYENLGFLLSEIGVGQTKVRSVSAIMSTDDVTNAIIERILSV